MNKFKNLIFLTLLSLCLACGKEDDVKVVDSEYFSLEVAGDVSGTIVYDESKYVAAGSSSPLSDDFDTYLMVTASEFDRTMTLNFYPPDDHPRAGDIFSLTIKASQLKPWTLENEYITPHISQLQQYDDHIIVSYYNRERNVDYVSYYLFENTSKEVKIWTEGELLKGELTGIKLANFNGSRQITVRDFNFQLRPRDEGLSMN
ncbi:hypothetical protein [Algoriphagus namhaensis]